MDNSADSKRRLLFLLGCFPTRLAAAYIVSKSSQGTRKLFAYFFAAVGLTMMYLAVSGTRLDGAETFGKGVWWSPHLRFIHSSIYLTFAALTFLGFDRAPLLLYADTLIGLCAFLAHEYRN